VYWTGGSPSSGVYRHGISGVTANKVSVDDADVSIETLGRGYKVKTGSNATAGIATLSGGTATISTTKVTASSMIFLTVQVLGTVAAPKAIAVTARTAATSFVINSADGADTSTVAWWILEPA
jgi:hypothetical protein